MLILALESATIGVGAAVVDHNGVLGVASELAGRLSTERLHPLIAKVMKETGVAMDDLDAIAVDIGPGLFTGLRVGVTTAKTLGYALGIPVIGLTSTRAILAGVRNPQQRSVAVIDMRRSEVVYAIDDAPDAMALVTPSACVEYLRSRPDLSGALFVGDGVSRYEAIFDELIRERGCTVASGSDRYVDPGVLGMLAVPELIAGKNMADAQLEPLYLRDADVKINWSTRSAVPGPES